MMPDEPVDPRLGTTVAGYRIERRLGRGGMGVVYVAEHQTLRRRAALKIVAPEFSADEAFRERFLREARTVATLVHPNVVGVYDAGEVGGELYLAMQLIPGRDLAAMLRTEGRLGPFRVLQVVRAVGGALDAAHAAGIVHRDVKPANVLVDGPDAYLTDFGLTKVAAATDPGSAPTRVGEVVGTSHYLAPEAIEGAAVDGRADLYALACVAFHALTGSTPFPRPTDMAVLYAHVHDVAPRLTALRPGLPPALDAVVARGLEKSPDRRWATCAAFVAAMAEVLDAAGPGLDAALAGDHVGRLVPADGDRPSQTTLVRPAGGASAPPAPATDPRPVPGGRPIMLLAGVEANARALARVAVGATWEVLEAVEVDAVQALARERRPDVVLVAASSTSAPAADVARALREDPVTRETHVVLLAPGRPGARELAAAGADDALAVPFSPIQLQVKLRRVSGARAG